MYVFKEFFSEKVHFYYLLLIRAAEQIQTGEIIFFPELHTKQNVNYVPTNPREQRLILRSQFATAKPEVKAIIILPTSFTNLIWNSLRSEHENT